MVKVGDKIKVVNPFGGWNDYRKGDVLTVESVSVKGIKTKEAEVPLVHSEYEPYKPIKVGDTVKLIDKFYEHDAFKKLSRDHRKDIANQVGKELKLTFVCDGWVSYTAEKQGAKSIPVELLEKVEELPDKPGFEAGKSYIFDKTLLERKPRPDSWESDIDGKSVEFIPGNTKGSVGFYVVERRWCREAEQLPEKPKPGDLFKVIGNSGVAHYFEIGEIVRLVQPFGWTYDCICNGYCKLNGGIYDQIIRISDLEPYTKHRYTDEQISEAQRIIGEIVADFPNSVSLKFRKEGNRTYTYIDGVNFDRFATCSKADEYNQTIGRMVALCKQVRRPLPEWL